MARDYAKEAGELSELAEEHKRLAQVKRDLANASTELKEIRKLNAEAAEAERQAAEKNVQALEKLASQTDLTQQQYDTLISKLNDAKDTLKDQTDAAEKGAKAMDTLGEAADDFFDSLAGGESTLEKFVEKLKNSDDAAADIKESFKKAWEEGKILKIVSGSLTEILVGLAIAAFKIAMANDKAIASFNKATGTSNAYRQQLSDLYYANNLYGVSMEDNANAMKSLFTGMTQFTALNTTQQNQLVEQAALLEKVGVATDDYAASIEISTKMLGMSTDAAMEATNELTAVAKDMGVLPATMIKDFTAAGPVLAKFGDQGVEVFKDLAATAKATGIETQRLLDITAKFDTFEGAAQSVGSLNAILGGDYLNSLDMMTVTDPTERLLMMKDAVDQAGMSFDSMGYYERIALAEAMGLKDVGELAMLMSGNMDQFAGSTQASAEELAEQQAAAATAMDVQQKLMALLADNSEAFIKIAEAAISFVDTLAVMAPAIKFLMPLLITLAIALKFLGIVQLFQGGAAKFSAKQMWFFIAALVVIATILYLTTYMSNFVEGIFKLGLGFMFLAAGLRLLNGVSKGVIPILLALGGAMLMIGAGIKMAADGFANLADSMAQLNPEQLQMFNTALYVLVGTFIFFAIALVFLGKMASNPKVAAGILVISFALLMIGIAIGIAAAGIGLMAEGFAQLATAIGGLNPEQLSAFSMALIGFGIAFAVFVGIVAALVYTGLAVAAGVAMMAFAKALFVMGAAVMVAGIGLNFMAVGMEALMNNMNPEKMALFSEFALATISAALFFFIAGVGLIVFAVGMGALALSLALIKTADLEAIASFAQGMASIEYETLTAVADEIERMVSAIDDLPAAKTVALTGLLKVGGAELLEALRGGGGGEGEGEAAAASTRPIEMTVQVHIGNEQLDERIRTISAEEQENMMTGIFRF